jgi:hypothetical protein
VGTPSKVLERGNIGAFTGGGKGLCSQTFPLTVFHVKRWIRVRTEARARARGTGTGASAGGRARGTGWWSFAPERLLRVARPAPVGRAVVLLGLGPAGPRTNGGCKRVGAADPCLPLACTLIGRRHIGTTRCSTRKPAVRCSRRGGPARLVPTATSGLAVLPRSAPTSARLAVSFGQRLERKSASPVASPPPAPVSSVSDPACERSPIPERPLCGSSRASPTSVSWADCPHPVPVPVPRRSPVPVYALAPAPQFLPVSTVSRETLPRWLRSFFGS